MGVSSFSFLLKFSQKEKSFEEKLEKIMNSREGKIFKSLEENL